VAGVTTTELSAVDETGCGVGDDPQLDRVSTAADSVVITKRLFTQFDGISFTSVGGEFQGTRRKLQWTQH
jgi:hypothetical protein